MNQHLEILGAFELEFEKLGLGVDSQESIVFQFHNIYDQLGFVLYLHVLGYLPRRHMSSSRRPWPSNPSLLFKSRSKITVVSKASIRTNQYPAVKTNNTQISSSTRGHHLILTEPPLPTHGCHRPCQHPEPPQRAGRHGITLKSHSWHIHRVSSLSP